MQLRSVCAFTRGCVVALAVSRPVAAAIVSATALTGVLVGEAGTPAYCRDDLFGAGARLCLQSGFEFAAGRAACDGRKFAESGRGISPDGDGDRQCRL